VIMSSITPVLIALSVSQILRNQGFGLPAIGISPRPLWLRKFPAKRRNETKLLIQGILHRWSSMRETPELGQIALWV
jgi:hypothetical protein